MPPTYPDVTDGQLNNYTYNASVISVVDGDTIDVEIDLGFETRITARVRVADVNTAEVYGVDKDSTEYALGAAHQAETETFVENGSEAYEWPFYLYSREYERGKYGRIIGSLYSKAQDEWLRQTLINTFGDEVRNDE
jgi:micrococcal nuclease